MRPFPYILLIVVLSIAAWSLLAAAPAAPQPSMTAVTAALPAFLQRTSTRAVVIPPPIGGPVQRLGGPLGTSVMPPGPPSGADCSVDANSPNPTCSAFAQQERCSAFNDNGNFCSANVGPQAGMAYSCSTFGRKSVCSVLPPAAAGNPSFCSAFLGIDFFAACSAVGTANRQLCSTKDAGLSQCSVRNTFGFAAECSVRNFGAPTRSFCSTKFNQPTIAKSCSAFDQGTLCSVVMGGNGVCTTFGAAAAPSCSAFDPGAFCSVMGGAPGTRCVQ